MDNATCEDEQQRCSNPFLTAISWKADAVEPRTGIKFPTVLEAGDSNFNPPTKEVKIMLDVGICLHILVVCFFLSKWMYTC